MRLTNKRLIKVIAEWSKHPGFVDYQIGDRVEFLTPEGLFEGVITRRSLTKHPQNGEHTFSVQTAPGVIRTTLPMLMRQMDRPK